MTADLLCEAAALMRERAEAADADERTWRADANALLDVSDDTFGHAASWHPAVALAVADWLDTEAAAHSGEIFDHWRGADDCCRMPSALAVARAYLGRDS